MFGTTKAALVAAAIGTAALTTLPAQSQEFDFSGKQVTILIGFGPGGTYGQYSQLIAEHLGKHLPGKPNVIVESRPGAGGMTMANYAAQALPADGYNYIMPADTSVLVQLMQPKKVKYDIGKFTWIGSANQTNIIVVMRSDTGVKTWEDLTKAEQPMASTGLGSVAYIGPKLMNGLLDTKMKVVSGYKSSGKAGLSIEQGETRGAGFNWLFWKSKYESWFEGDEPFARAVMQIGYERDPEVPDSVPMLSDVVDEKDKPLVDFVGALGLIGRGLAAPPGTPEPAIEAMRAAWEELMEDPEFRADADKRKLRVIPTPGAKVQDVVNAALEGAKPEIVARATEIVYGK